MVDEIDGTYYYRNGLDDLNLIKKKFVDSSLKNDTSRSSKTHVYLFSFHLGIL